VAEGLPVMRDANLWRKIPFAILIAALILFGVAPGLLTKKIEPAAKEIVAMAQGKAQAVAAEQRAEVK
jgi:NADH:ubiquinone oxidoreductase subunit 4 (subunit M)